MAVGRYLLGGFPSRGVVEVLQEHINKSKGKSRRCPQGFCTLLGYNV